MENISLPNAKKKLQLMIFKGALKAMAFGFFVIIVSLNPSCSYSGVIS